MLPRPMKSRSLTAATVIASLALAACGSNASDEKDVKKTVKGVYDALADKNAKKVCDSISERGRQRIENSAAKGRKHQSCVQLFGIGLAFAGDSLKQAKNVKIGDVSVKGDQAKATVSLQGRKSQIGLVKEHGDWKLSGLDLAGGG
jgi:hypothetical protein